MQYMSEIVAIVLLHSKEKMFSRTFRFLHFFVRTFSFYIFWCMEKYKAFFCLSLLTSYVSFPFTPLTFPKVVEETIETKLIVRRIVSCFEDILTSYGALLPCLVSSDIYSFVYTKSFFRQEFSPSQSLTTFHV